MNNYTETKKVSIKKRLSTFLIGCTAIVIMVPTPFSIRNTPLVALFPTKSIPTLQTAAPKFRAYVNYQRLRNNDVFKIGKLTPPFTGMFGSYDVTQMDPHVNRARKSWISHDPPEQLSNKQTHEVLIDGKKYFITTFTYKETNYWSMLGNRVRYKDGDKVARKLTAWVSIQPIYKNYTALPFTVVYDHVYP